MTRRLAAALGWTLLAIAFLAGWISLWGLLAWVITR